MRTDASVGTYILFHRQYAVCATKHSPLKEQRPDIYILHSKQQLCLAGCVTPPDIVCSPLMASVHPDDGVESISQMEAPVWHIPLPPVTR
jgi:hypothetical protein